MFFLFSRTIVSGIAGWLSPLEDSLHEVSGPVSGDGVSFAEKFAGSVRGRCCVQHVKIIFQAPIYV